MKYFRFALSGMVVLLYLLGSCKAEEAEHGVQEVIEEASQDDEAEAKEGAPVTENGEEDPADGKKPDASSPDDEGGDPPDETPGVLSLQINELRFGFSGEDSVGFIEFKILSAGNLGRLQVFIASNPNKLVFEFLPVEVKKGDYVVLHPRTIGTECKDEYGEDLNESGGADASPTARDFWIPGSTELLSKDDAVYIMDQDERVLDAVIILENTGAINWPTLSGQNFLSIINYLFNKDAWQSAGGTSLSPADAVNVSTAVNDHTRSVSRNETVEDTNTKADWYVTASNGATPGMENSPRPK